MAPPPQFIHKAGPLKQSNKRHKGIKTKGQRHYEKGKIDVKTISIRKKHVLNRQERRNRLKQIRENKREVVKSKARFGNLLAAPVLTTILSLDDAVDSRQFLESLQKCDDNLVVADDECGHSHINCPKLKGKFMFLTPNNNDLHSIMDALKVSENLVLLHSTKPLDDWTEMLLSVIVAHALPTTHHVLYGLNEKNFKRKAENRRQISKMMESRFPAAKLQQVDSEQDFKLLLRQIGSTKQRPIKFRDNRFHLLVEKYSFQPSETDTGKGTLKVSGYVRGRAINVNGLVQIPGYGTYQLSEVVMDRDPYSMGKAKELEFVSAVEHPNPVDQESLQSEVVPDPMEGEQTWPTQEELDEADMELEKVTKKKVKEGTSDYQAAWIVEEGDFESTSDTDDDDIDMNDTRSQVSQDESINMETDNMDDTESIAETVGDNYDKQLDMDEEKATFARIKEERMNQMFPDELDTPMDVSAKVRFQRYRGLKNFRAAPWDPKENLPLDYARIYRFQHFKQTKKKVLAKDDSAEIGYHVTISIAAVPQSVYDNIQEEKSTFIVYGLLPHEQKMSVMNTVIRKHPTCKVPVKSKDTLIFHVGFSRFTVKPIFSEHKSGNKFKFERFLPTNDAAVASFYAPVTFPPAPVVVFRQKQDGSHELVATGSVLDVNPNRVIVKRIILSGHPLKILKRSAVVRYMFFNKDDINWFKPVQLYSKYGRHGHIREALGSHGHMKCVFDRQLHSQDVVLMNLYKRVFPKWTYDTYVPSPVY